MPGKKAKGKTISLHEFHAQHEESGGDGGELDWADDVPVMEDKRPARSNGFSGGGSDWRSGTSSDAPAGGSRFSTAERGGAGARRQGGPIQWPERPPFTAFVGNFAFEVTESDLVDFFEGARNARVMRQGETSKGYGYVEFNTLQDLKSAVERTDEVYKGRKIRVDVTDPKESKGPGAERSGFNAQATSDWRSGMGVRSAPEPSDRPARRDDRPAPREQPNFSRDIFGGAREATNNNVRDAPPPRAERQQPAFSRDALGSGLRAGDDAQGEKRERVERAAPSFSRNEMGSGIEAQEQFRKEREEREEKRKAADELRRKERESKGLTYSTDSAPTRDIFGGSKPSSPGVGKSAAASPASTGAGKSAGPWERGSGGYSAARPFRDDTRANFRDREEAKPENESSAPRRDWRSDETPAARGASFRDSAPKQKEAPKRDFNFRDRPDDATKSATPAAAAPTKPATPAADESAAEPGNEHEPAVTDWDAELDVLLPQDKDLIPEPQTTEADAKPAKEPKKQKPKPGKDGWTTIDASEKPKKTQPKESKEEKKPKKKEPANCFAVLNKRK